MNTLPSLRTTIAVQIPASEVPVLLSSLVRPYYCNLATSTLQQWDGHRFVNTNHSLAADPLQSLLNLEVQGDVVIDDIEDTPKVRSQIKQSHFTKLPQRWIFPVSKAEVLKRMDGFVVYHRWEALSPSEVAQILKDRGLYSDYLYRSCLGMYQQELESVLNWSDDPESILEQYKKDKLSGKGITHLPTPNVQAAGLENVDDIIDRVTQLLSLEAREAGLPFPKGMLLMGPPGTGKTLIAKNSATRMGVPLINVVLGGLLSPISGESEENLTTVFDIAEKNAPCILYFDDVDKAFASSDLTGLNSVEKRLVQMLLTWMNEHQSLVFTIASCNRVEQLPPEFIRAGRLAYKVMVDLPHDGAKYNIFRTHLKRFTRQEQQWNEDEQENILLWKDLFLAFDQCTPAEIEHAVTEAAIEAFLSGTPGQISHSMLLEQREKMAPANIVNPEQIRNIQHKSRHYPKAAIEDDSIFCYQDSSEWVELLHGSKAS
jgi:hypothetical protein